MIVTQIACLAHSDGIVQLVGMLAVPSSLVSAKLSIARGAHVLGVMLSMNMWALRDLHRVCVSSLDRCIHNSLLGVNGHVVIAVTVVLMLMVVQKLIDDRVVSNGSWLINSYLLSRLGSSLDLGVHELLLEEVLQKLGVKLARYVSALVLTAFLMHNHLRERIKDLHFKILGGKKLVGRERRHCCGLQVVCDTRSATWVNALSNCLFVHVSCLSDTVVSQHI